MIILGARPQFIKSAPIIHEFIKRDEKSIDLKLVHSGQHYDYELSEIFFKELSLPPPFLDLNVGSGSHATQTGKAMIRLEQCMINAKPDIVLVPGDTNTTLAAALAAAKLNLKLGHIEAGARSYDMTMPEEVNRKVTDHVSHMLFAPTETTARNLYAEGVPNENVILSGDTMLDALLKSLPSAIRIRDELSSKFDIDEEGYVLVTVHRPRNADSHERLRSIVKAMIEISKTIKIIIPVHPRTYDRLENFQFISQLKRCENVLLTEPLGYLELIALLDSSTAVLTDSGGIQKEAFLLGVPCATMRSVTEWPETLKDNSNKLVDADENKIVKTIIDKVERGKKRSKPLYMPNPFGEGKSSVKIVDVILRS